MAGEHTAGYNTGKQSEEEAVARGVQASGFVGEFDPVVSELDRRLAIGAEVCARMRAAVKAKTGFTMSGGVAHNKMLAKLASARNKPNKQTIVSWRAVGEMMASLPMRSIKGLGGKFGEQVEALLAAHLGSHGTGGDAAMHPGSGRGSASEGGFMASTLQSLPHKIISCRFDAKTATWLTRVGRGEDTDAVTPNVRDGIKSINAFKSFAAIPDVLGVHRWLRVLSGELAGRLLEDRVALRRTPKLLKLEYRANLKASHLRDWTAGRASELTEMRSRSFAFPAAATSALSAAAAATATAATAAAATAAAATAATAVAAASTVAAATATAECGAARLATTVLASAPTTERGEGGAHNEPMCEDRAGAEAEVGAGAVTGLGAGAEPGPGPGLGAGAENSLRESAGEAIALAAIKAFDRAGREALPCTRVGLSAGDFTLLPPEGSGIAKFFGKASAGGGDGSSGGGGGGGGGGGVEGGRKSRAGDLDSGAVSAPLPPRPQKRNKGLDRFFKPAAAAARVTVAAAAAVGAAATAGSHWSEVGSSALPSQSTAAVAAVYLVSKQMPAPELALVDEPGESPES
jgi:hypothetical protein